MNKEELKKQLIEWRHYLHTHPEAAFEEVNTSAFVAEKLREMGIEVETGVGKTGVVGTLKVGDGDRVIGLRADMDCICLQEATGLPYQSQNETGCMPADMTDIPRHCWGQQSCFRKARIFLVLYASFFSRQKNQAMARWQ